MKIEKFKQRQYYFDEFKTNFFLINGHVFDRHASLVQFFISNEITGMLLRKRKEAFIKANC